MHQCRSLDLLTFRDTRFVHSAWSKTGTDRYGFERRVREPTMRERYPSHVVLLRRKCGDQLIDDLPLPAPSHGVKHSLYAVNLPGELIYTRLTTSQATSKVDTMGRGGSPPCVSAQRPDQRGVIFMLRTDKFHVADESNLSSFDPSRNRN